MVCRKRWILFWVASKQPFDLYRHERWRYAAQLRLGPLFTQQRFSLSVSYRFGELKASVRKAERTISNDDLKGGGSRGGSGGESSN